MSLIQNLGPETAPIWIVLDDPYLNDSIDEGGSDVIFSGGYGHNFKKIWKLTGLSLNDVCIKSLRPCIGASYMKENILSNFLVSVDTFKPSLIVPLSDEILNYLVPDTQQAKENNSSLMKWAGSLLTSRYISHPHYIIGSHPPDWVTKNWDYNEIQAFIDFGHVKEEYEYLRANGTLQPLPKRNLLTEPSYSDLVSYLTDCRRYQLISVDIETIRPKQKSFYHKENPGYPYTIAIATSPKEACSFSFWDYTPEQCVRIWRLLDEILTKVPQVGQNYFLFDAHYLESMGFRLCLASCRDTLIRHHILWPSLKHALHFQTRQYTREPYYKDEGKNFNVKRKKQFMTYNAKDAACTFEIYEAQEEEFRERPYLI